MAEIPEHPLGTNASHEQQMEWYSAHREEQRETREIEAKNAVDLRRIEMEERVAVQDSGFEETAKKRTFAARLLIGMTVLLVWLASFVYLTWVTAEDPTIREDIEIYIGWVAITGVPAGLIINQLWKQRQKGDPDS